MKKILNLKDENGAYLPLPKAVEEVDQPNPDISLDDIGKMVINALHRATRHLLAKVTAGTVDRDTVGALKDCQSMLKDLKKDERDFLESLTDEQLMELKVK